MLHAQKMFMSKRVRVNVPRASTRGKVYPTSTQLKFCEHVTYDTLCTVENEVVIELIL